MTDLHDYIESHTSPEPEWLYDLNRRTNLRLLNGRMCSGPVQGRFLKMLTSMARPMKALELGTFSGYSALCLAEGMPKGSILHTVEADDELEDFIRESLALAPREISEKIQLHIGNALDVVGQFPDASFDFAFIDASKREYPAYLKAVLPKMKPGSFIAADNTLWDGHVADPAYDRDPQTLGVREFNDLVASHPCLETVILPLRDGLTLMRVSTLPAGESF